MDDGSIRRILEKAVERMNGILYLRPCWVARDFLPPGKRLGLKEEEFAVGERGFISERWIGSETRAENRIGPEDEGLSYLKIEGENILLKDAVRVCGPLIMGEAYAKNHPDLGRLPKLYDFDSRIFYHIHQMKGDANKVGKNPKEEAYYFLEDVDLGKHPETFFGVHPHIVEQGKQYDLLLPYLVNWNSDLILKHARAYLNVPGEGFHLPAGVLHAPGTALTLELQESSDVFAMLQAKLNNIIHSKELLFKDVSKEDRNKDGELAVLKQIDWKTCADPYFYENRHMEPKLVKETKQEGGFEEWIYYNTMKFSGKKLTVKPASSFRSSDKGVYNVLVWKGSGTIDGHEVEGTNFGIDEVLVTHAKAVQGFEIKNTGSTDLVLFKFFGPDINTDIPYIPVYKP
jgi:hypothetical protein